MMCSDLAEELSFFDLQKEKEVKQILLDYATSQLERHEKVCTCVTRGVGPLERHRCVHGCGSTREVCTYMWFMRFENNYIVNM